MLVEFKVVAIREKYINNKPILEIWLCLALTYYVLWKTVGFQTEPWSEAPFYKQHLSPF